MNYDKYFRLDKYDIWLSKTGHYRIEYSYGDRVWTGQFTGVEAEDDSRSSLKLKHKRGSVFFSYDKAQDNSCSCELSIPRLFMGNKIFRGKLSEARVQQIFSLLKQI